jgi:6-pyruvoyltetrahydropterin/6-carboxytetrahydropterin synthase
MKPQLPVLTDAETPPPASHYVDHPVPKPSMPAGASMRIGRHVEFCSSHFLPYVSEGHKCRRLHGHNYIVAIEVEGPVNELLGWVADFDHLQVALDLCVKNRLDHLHLNDIDGLENPTSEMLALWVWQQLTPYFDGIEDVSLCSVRVSERGNSWALLERR